MGLEKNDFHVGNLSDIVRIRKMEKHFMRLL